MVKRRKNRKGSIGDITFTASYTINQYKVTVTPSISGICRINDAGKYDYNTAVSLSLSNLYLGYKFVGWYNGETLLSTDNVYTFNVPANDITITAKLSVKEEMNNYNFTSTTGTCNITGVKDKTITSAVIPDYVTSIGRSAFYGCSRLTSITIGNGVTSIDTDAFSGCSGLTSVTIPDSVTSIGRSAFYGCSKITNITLPFVGATLNGTSNTHFGYIFGASFSSDNNQYVPSNLKTVIISNKSGVTSIGDYAFRGCNGLTSITIPDSVTSIYSSTFAYCSGLTSITIPDGVTSIGYEAFYGCSKLKYNEYDNGLYLGNSSNPYHALINTKSNDIINFVINKECKLIGNSAFEGCSGLKNVTIPDSVTSIGDYAFLGCSGLTDIEIPDGVTSIGNNAFLGCNNLKYSEYENTLYLGNSNNPYVILVKAKDTTITSCMIHNKTKFIHSSAFFGCSGLTSVTIPDNVTSIGDYAFAYCSGLTSITIPDSVTSIGNNAFTDCSGLTEIHFNGTMAQWDAIEKDANWDYKIDSYTIYCTDGNIKK